jgi:trimeric autotransporter adhesin
MACLIFLQFLPGCGGGSGNSGGGPPPPTANPVPTIASLSPNSANAGGAPFTLTITGENFTSSSTVQWNGSLVTSTYSTSSQLQAQITGADIATPGSALVSIINPAPGGGNSGSAEFTINATSNVAPSLTSLSPSSVAAGTSGFILTLNGADFVPTSTIQWNGAALPTNYLSATQLEAQIPASDVAVPGFAEVAVLSPAPGGGTSSSETFTISYGATIVSQLANDLVWDAAHQLIYLSVPSLAPSNGNTVLALNPLTGSIQSSQFAGSEPDMLAVDDADQFLYVGLNGAASVQRFTLPDLLPDIDYSIGADPLFGPTVAVDLEVAPGLPHTTAVSRGAFGSADCGMVVYDDATPRSTTTGDREGTFDSLQWGSDATIYANNNETTSFDLYVLTVSSTGVTATKDYPNEFSPPFYYVSIHYDSGTNLVYADDGYVIDPSNGQRVGAFQASGLMIPDSALNSAFFLGQTASQSGTTNFTIESFDLTTFAPTAEIVVPNVQGNPLHFILWGTNGLAFNDDAGYVYVLNNPFVAADGSKLKTPLRYIGPVARTKSRPKMIQPTQVVARRSGPTPKVIKHSYESSDSSPVPSITTLSPSAVTAGVNGFTLTVTGTNFLSLSTILWNSSQLPTEYVSSSRLQAQVSASDVATADSISVTVVTPSPGGGTSTVLPFTVVPASSAVPVVLGFDPSFVTAGSPAFTLSMNGLTNSFEASSLVTWNGSPRAASLNAEGQLQIQISASDIATAGFAQITISNPGPGGGTTTAEYQILYQPTIVSQATNDLVWDPLNQVIYISVPSSASAHANQVCILNPVTAKIVNCEAAGSEPDVLAISDDSQYLYVGEDGTGSVQRFTLPGLVPDITYSLGNYDSAQPYYALDLQVAPGAPHTTAVSKGVLDLEPATEGGISIFDDSTPRPTSVLGWGPTLHSYDSIQWGSDTTALYAADTENENQGFDFYTLTVSSSGIVLDQDYPNVFWNPGRIHYNSDTGLVYSDDGFHAINPTTGLPAGIFEAGGPMAPDATLNTVFSLIQYGWQVPSNFTIELLDMTHYIPVNRIPFSAAQDDLAGLNRFIRWGTNGLALNDTAGNLYLISGPFISGDQQSGSQRRAKPVRMPSANHKTGAD